MILSAREFLPATEVVALLTAHALAFRQCKQYEQFYFQATFLGQSGFDMPLICPNVAACYNNHCGYIPTFFLRYNFLLRF